MASESIEEFRQEVHGWIEENLPAELRGELEANLKDMVDELGDSAAGVKIDTSLRVGLPYQQICDHAENAGVDLVVMATLGRTGLLHHFEDRLFSAAGLARGKPHPDVFLHAAEAMGAEPGDCAVIEDSPVGVRAGIAAGMKVFGYAALTDTQVLSAAGARVFSDMGELPGLLEQ